MQMYFFVSTCGNLSKCKDQHCVQPKGHKGLNFIPRANLSSPAEQFPMSHAVCAACGTGSGCSDPSLTSLREAPAFHISLLRVCVLPLMRSPGPAAERSTQRGVDVRFDRVLKGCLLRGRHQPLVDKHRGEAGHWGLYRAPACGCEQGTVLSPSPGWFPGLLPCIPNRWCCAATQS